MYVVTIKTLTLSVLDRKLDYKEVLKLCVCNMTSQKCMLNHCDNCPQQSVIKDFLTVQLLKNYDTSSSISFKQWVNTDHSQLLEKEYDFDEFIDSLTTMFIELTEHHYIAKKK